MNGRLPCIVPFCRCTMPADCYPPGWEIICAKHWRAVPKALKACYRRARTARRALAQADEAARQRDLASPDAQVFRSEGMHPIETARWLAVARLGGAENRCVRLWRVCKRRAIEAAGGVG